MDFAENYTTGYQEEVQSAYYDRAQITLHPVVVHYVDKNLQHKTFMCITDERNDSASAVVAFMKEVAQKIRILVPGLTQIHYLTDSPTSQY